MYVHTYNALYIIYIISQPLCIYHKWNEYMIGVI